MAYATSLSTACVAAGIFRRSSPLNQRTQIQRTCLSTGDVLANYSTPVKGILKNN